MLGACAWPKCVSSVAISWLGKTLCERHWGDVCRLTSSGKNGFIKAYGILGVPKRFWASVTTTKDHKSADDYGDLPDPDKFDYEL